MVYLSQVKNGKSNLFVIDNGDEFNNLTAVSAFGNKNVEQLGRLELGMDVAILCNVYSREYQGKYYHNIDGYHFTDQSARVAHEAEESSPF